MILNYEGYLLQVQKGKEEQQKTYLYYSAVFSYLHKILIIFKDSAMILNGVSENIFFKADILLLFIKSVIFNFRFI